jgi:hypothetical protein
MTSCAVSHMCVRAASRLPSRSVWHVPRSRFTHAGALVLVRACTRQHFCARMHRWCFIVVRQTVRYFIFSPTFVSLLSHARHTDVRGRSRARYGVLRARRLFDDTKRHARCRPIASYAPLARQQQSACSCLFEIMGVHIASGLIPSALLSRIAGTELSVSLLVCLLGRCAVWCIGNHCTSSEQLVVLRQQSSIVTAALSRRQHVFFVRSTFELVTFLSTCTCIAHTVAAPRSPTPRLRASHRIQSPHSTPFEKMDKVRLAILLSVGTPRHRCAASFHPSGKRMCTFSNGMHTHLSRAVSYSPAWGHHAATRVHPLIHHVNQSSAKHFGR